MRVRLTFGRGCARALGVVGIFLSLGPLATRQAPALEFARDQLTGSLDNTLSYGLSSRVSGRDADLVGVANGGKGWSVNVDDGNLNYDDLVSNRVRWLGELELSYRDIGAFIRGTAFYDFESENASRARTDLSDSALHLVGKRARLLDAYAWWRFDAGKIPGEIRIGNQVLSWGESTFIQNGINSINPVDVAVLRSPGAQLKDALIPVPMVWANVAPTENTSLEGFYQFAWQETEIDPAGYYFSGNDFATPGADRVLLGRGTFADGALPDGSFKPVADTFQAVYRTADRKASNGGQFGLAFHYFSDLLNGTEFGVFFINNHSRLPMVNGITGTAAGALNASKIAGSPATPGTGAAVAVTALTQGVPAAVQLGQQLGQTENQARNIAAEAAAEGTVGPKTKGAIADSATDAFSRTALYRTTYPENIQTFGVSFNTEVGTTGWALQGEVSYKLDAPIQVNTIELLGALLGAINPAAAQANQVGNFLGQFQTEIPGFIREDIFQTQFTATRLFGRTLGADALALVGEVGVTWVPGLPDQHTGGPTGNGLRLNGPNTGLGGNAALAPTPNQAFAGQVLGSSHFVSDVSWGYQIRAQLRYNNAIGPVNLLPRIAWRQDVSGISPGPGENFLAGRKAVSVGLGATYLNEWSADLSYVNFFGAGEFNLQNDRDFVSFSLSYSF